MHTLINSKLLLFTALHFLTSGWVLCWPGCYPGGLAETELGSVRFKSSFKAPSVPQLTYCQCALHHIFTHRKSFPKAKWLLL